jgi:A/G-specific adenine glycosylase
MKSYPTTIQVSKFQEFLLDWYKEHGRDFPWRQSTDPYLILVSEFLLQKTNVRTVVDVYEEFISTYPTIGDLAEAQKQNVEEIIRPLGLLYRAKRMINTAIYICENHEGEIPQDFDTLINMPGIGNYIATAILVFAFGECRVIVDTNVVKVLKEEFDFFSQKRRPRTDKKLWQFAQSLAPCEKIREFNYAIIDYGATL